MYPLIALHTARATPCSFGSSAHSTGTYRASPSTWRRSSPACTRPGSPAARLSSVARAGMAALPDSRHWCLASSVTGVCHLHDVHAIGALVHKQSQLQLKALRWLVTDFLRNKLLNKSFNRFLIISLDVLICRYSPSFRAFPALFISEEPHKSFYYPSCFRSQK